MPAVAASPLPARLPAPPLLPRCRAAAPEAFGGVAAQPPGPHRGGAAHRAGEGAVGPPGRRDRRCAASPQRSGGVAGRGRRPDRRARHAPRVQPRLPLQARGARPLSGNSPPPPPPPQRRSGPELCPRSAQHRHRQGSREAQRFPPPQRRLRPPHASLGPPGTRCRAQRRLRHGRCGGGRGLRQAASPLPPAVRRRHCSSRQEGSPPSRLSSAASPPRL